MFVVVVVDVVVVVVLVAVVVVVAFRVNNIQVMFAQTTRDNVNVYRSGKNKSFFFKNKSREKKYRNKTGLNQFSFFAATTARLK